MEHRRGAGGLAGVTAGGYTAAKTADSVGSGLAIFTVIAGAAIVGGYFVGPRLDKRNTEIRVVP
jgi:hypothetical protein